MLDVPFDEITEGHIRGLIDNAAEESLRLEFKREIHIDSRDQKLEAAKDASAMANTVGGRILYGVEERRENDGTHVAAGLSPLLDGELEERLQNVLNTTLHPRARFRTKKIPAEGGGFVLLLEVWPSYGNDLHMVHGFGEYRFYKRGEKGTVKMTEPEVREAYMRLAASRGRLEETVEKEVRREFRLRRNAQFSIVAVPWFSRPELIDPRHVPPTLGHELAQELFDDLGHMYKALRDLRIWSSGLRYTWGARKSVGLEDAETYLCISKDGTVHLSELEIIRGDCVFAATLVSYLLVGLHIARFFLDRAGYWGAVRILSRLRLPPDRNYVKFRQDDLGYHDRGRIQGVCRQTVYDEDLRRTGTDLEPIVAELMDQICHVAGIPRCEVFDESGHLTEAYRARYSWALPKPHKVPRL